jgi:hypothetical protein
LVGGAALAQQPADPGTAAGEPETDGRGGAGGERETASQRTAGANAASGTAGAGAAMEEVVPRPSKKWPIAFGGAAVGVLIIGGALGGAALARANEQNGDAKAPPLYTQDLHDRGEQGKTMAVASYAFLGIGAALALVDAVLWYEALRKPQLKKPATAASLGPAGVRF